MAESDLGDLHVQQSGSMILNHFPLDIQDRTQNMCSELLKQQRALFYIQWQHHIQISCPHLSENVISTIGIRFFFTAI